MKNLWISVVLLSLLPLPGWSSVGQQSDGLSDLDHVNTSGKNAVLTGRTSKDEVSLKGRVLPWDVNRDGEVNIADVNNVIDYILYGCQQEISSAYYYVGTSNGWTPGDATYKLDNGGGDVYSNPCLVWSFLLRMASSVLDALTIFLRFVLKRPWTWV